MRERELRITDDGSHTLYSDCVGETYHSTYGAIQESEHIFIDAGLNTFGDKNHKHINLLEVGTGTGLNILLAYLWSEKTNTTINYHGYEPFPLNQNETLLLNYPEKLGIDEKLFSLIHDKIGMAINLSNKFSLSVKVNSIENAKLPPDFYNVVFYDAFSPEAQPEMWTKEIFHGLFKSLKRGGILNTYSCKGTVKRLMKDVGFAIEKLPGPPGKREFLRARKKIVL